MSFFIGAWAECRLRKLLHEEFGFSEVERISIESRSTQTEQWEAAVDEAFRKHHRITKAPLDEVSLGVAHAARRTALLDVLRNELKIIIEIRNKLAHGQWIYPFNTEGSAVEPEKYRLINQENVLSLQFKLALLGHLADAIHDLVVSPKTFERDFEDHFRKLFQVRTNIVRRSYEKYASSLVAARRNARAKRGP